MRLFILFTILWCLCASAQTKDSTLIDEFISGYQSVKLECINLTNVEETKVELLERAEQIHDYGLYCYVGCIMSKLNMIDEQGHLKKDQIPDLHRELYNEKSNAKVKSIVGGIFKGLQRSRNTCDAGRIVTKYIFELFFMP